MTNNNDLINMNGADGSDVGYTVLPNTMPASRAKAPFLGRTVIYGSYSQDDVAQRMASTKGCPFGVEEIKRLLNATGNYILAQMQKDPRPYEIGFVTFSPMIGGTFPSADAPFDKERNTLYVAATPSDAIRNALNGGVPTSTAPVADAPVITNVMWGGMSNTIKSGERFEIAGTFLTIGDAHDEYAELTLPKGGTVSVRIAPVEDGNWQRLWGWIDTPVSPCVGAALTVYSHGSDPERSLMAAKMTGITVLAGDPVGIPTVTNAKSTGYADRTVNIGGGDLTVEGENLATATEVKFLDPDGSEFYTVPVTYAGGKLVAADGTVRTEGPASGSVKVTTAGGAATLDVTFTTP